MKHQVISSRGNQHFKHLKKLNESPRYRHEVQQTILDGMHLIESYVERFGSPDSIALIEGGNLDKIASYLNEDTQVLEFPAGLFSEIAPVISPTGILASINIPHLEPLKNFEFTKEFVFVDVQPRSEFDSSDSFYEGFYRKFFVPELIDLSNKYGFQLEKTEELDSNYFVNILNLTQRILWLNNVKETWQYICPTLLTFFNSTTGQKLKYYISTNIIASVVLPIGFGV